MKKPFSKLLALFLALTVFLMPLSACGRNREAEELIKRFESACQELNADEILNCFNPRVTNPIKSVLGILGVDSLNQIVSGLADIWGVIDFTSSTPREILKTLTIKTEKFVNSENGGKCDVNAVFRYTDGNKTVVETVVINCVKGSEGWYIGSIKAGE